MILLSFSIILKFLPNSILQFRLQQCDVLFTHILNAQLFFLLLESEREGEEKSFKMHKDHNWILWYTTFYLHPMLFSDAFLKVNTSVEMTST